MTGLLRAAASEEAAAVLVRDLLMERLLGPLARHLGGEDPTLRASLAASQFAGLAFSRHVVGHDPGAVRRAVVHDDDLVARSQ